MQDCKCSNVTFKGLSGELGGAEVTRVAAVGAIVNAQLLIGVDNDIDAIPELSDYGTSSGLVSYSEHCLECIV